MRGLVEDVRTVVWKEERLVLRQPGGRLRALLTGLIPVVFLGLVLPSQAGPDFLRDPVFAVAAGFVMPLLVVLLVVPDSVAGERERRTLTSVLATRLPDRALLLGKTVFVAGAALAATVAVYALAWVVVNVVAFEQAPLAYRPLVLATLAGLSLSFTALMIPLGILVSLRAASVQQAQQTLGAILLLPPLLLQVVFVLGQGGLGGRSLFALFDGVAPVPLLAGTIAVLLAVAGLLWRRVLVRSRREQLVLGGPAPPR